MPTDTEIANRLTSLDNDRCALYLRLRRIQTRLDESTRVPADTEQSLREHFISIKAETNLLQRLQVCAGGPSPECIAHQCNLIATDMRGLADKIFHYEQA